MPGKDGKMEFDKALRASQLISDLEEINKMRGKVIEQRDHIDSELILNCKNHKDYDISSVEIPLEDAKRILQFIVEYYENEQYLICKKIDELN